LRPDPARTQFDYSTPACAHRLVSPAFPGCFRGQYLTVPG
jgi:hypothetical protein